MKNYTILIYVIILLQSCNSSSSNSKTETQKSQPPKKEITKPPVIDQTSVITFPWLESYNFKTSIVNQIQPPSGFRRKKTGVNSFANWLRLLPLFPNGEKVKLHNGEFKWNQNAHDRIINIDIGKADLQQCADAVMRLRSEYLFWEKDFEKIHFNFTNGTNVAYDDWRNGKKPIVKGNRVTFSEGGKKDNSYLNFKKYLKQIFMYAGTASLEKEMKAIPIMEMQIGDVLIQGGHPGHAVLVMDMVENEEGEKLFLLAQSYMPAQNIHLLKNPSNDQLSPWYPIDANNTITTPEWDFSNKDLKRFVD